MKMKIKMIKKKIKINSKSNKRFTVNYFNKEFNHISNIIATKENSKKINLINNCQINYFSFNINRISK